MLSLAWSAFPAAAIGSTGQDGLAILYDVIRAALYFFLVLLFVRFLVSWIMVFARDYRPRGTAAAVLEITYTVTDPPYKLLRRFIPPLRLGAFAFDVAFYVLFLLVYVLLVIIPKGDF